MFPELDPDNVPCLEGQLIDICNKIAQRTHDLDDGIRSGLIKISDVKEIIEKECEPIKNHDYVKVLIKGLKKAYDLESKGKDIKLCLPIVINAMLTALLWTS